jgi:hypothetical protein
MDRIQAPVSIEPIADIGAFALSNPPRTPFDVPTGLQFALDVYRGGFLVTYGHHNRVLRVTLDGTIEEFARFDNIVPTGLAVLGGWVLMAREVASGASLLVDDEFGPGALYALSQGEFPAGGAPAARRCRTQARS